MKSDAVGRIHGWLEWVVKEHGDELENHEIAEIMALMDDLKIEIERNKMAYERVKRYRQKRKAQKQNR